MEVKATTLREVISALEEICALVKHDINPAWAEPQEGRPGSSREAMKAWSQHFSCDEGELMQEFTGVHRARLAYVRDNPGAERLPVH
eukprot:1343180-Karenia_brevis.AAC.1